MSNRMRMGVVGLSSDHVWSMAGTFQGLEGVELVALADTDQELLDKGTKVFGVDTVYHDYVQMLDEVKPDAIVVCGDNASKVDIVEAAAPRGIHVCLDKPMSATLAQADRIVAATEQSNVVVFVAYHPAFRPSYQQAKQMVQKGDLGEVYLARGTFGHAGPKEIGLTPQFTEWLISKERNGGGAFVDEACYVLSAFMDYLGPIVEVSAFTAHMSWRDYVPEDVEDNSVAILRFASGALGVIDAKWGQIGRMPYYQSFHGSQGTLLATMEGNKICSRTLLPNDLQGWLDLSGAQSGPSGGAAPRGLAEAEAFVQCVHDNKQPCGPANIAAARAVQEVIEAAYRSAETGQAVKLPL